jgi:DNA-binding winged helix-turn-helix (wHTH) protein
VRFYFDEFELDLDRVELRRAGTPTKMEPTVLRLLEVLVRAEGRVVTKDELLDQVWGGRVVAENVITVAMTRLRKTLGHAAGQREFVNNVHGRGYRFVCPVAQQPPASSNGAAPALRGGSAPDAARAVHTSKPFVGRERVLAELASALAETDAGHGNACVLTGEPGIGKTRALEVFARELASRGMFVAWGHCRESEDTPPLWPFAQVLRQLRTWSPRHEKSSEPVAWAAQLVELAKLSPELLQDEATRPTRGERGESGDRLAKHRLFDAIIQLLASVSEQHTCVLVLDDLHRADAASLELLHSWIDQLPRMRILLLAAFPRIEEARSGVRAQLAYLHGHRNVARLMLKPLCEADVTHYVSALIDAASDALAHAVFVKSEGNPFFMSELVRQLSASESGPASADLAVPEAALELVRRRLAILDEAARGALSYAAVIGRRFELSILQEVTGQGTRALSSSLDAAVMSEVVLCAPDSPTSFVFAHDLLRVALCESLPPAALRNSHLRVALALEERLLAGMQTPMADIAFHFHAALPDGDLRKTVKYCSAAADESIHLFALADGRRHLRSARQALELTEKPSQRLRFAMLLREAVLARDCRDADFEPLLREAIHLASEREMWPQLALAGIMLNLNPGFPALSGSREVLERTLQGLAPNEPARALVFARLATSAPLGFDAHASSDQVARALEIASQSNQELPLLIAREAQLYLHAGALDQTQASDAMQALGLLGQCLAGRITRVPMLLDLHRAIRSLQVADMAGFDAALDRCEAAARTFGEHELDWYVERARAMQIFYAGDSQTAVKRLQALHRAGPRAAPPGSGLLQAYDQCVISAEISKLSSRELRALLEPDSADSPNIHALKVRALASVGMHDEARAQLRAFAPERIARLPRDRDYLGTLAALTHAVIDLRAEAYVEALFSALAEYPEHFSADISFYCEPVPRLMGLLAHMQARDAESAALFATAAAMAERAGLASAER